MHFSIRQGVGILCALHRKLSELEDTNQDFITTTLQKLSERLSGLFSRFVDEQIRAIEDTKVKIKKRKGVIAFMRTFPLFCAAIEGMLPSVNDDAFARLEVRNMVDSAYGKINKAMFESLKVIAKESPMLMAKEGMGDPEDKEALNYHILLIENMNHYLEEVDDKGDNVLGEWKRRATDELAEHMDLYVDAVIRRPLGKLLVSKCSYHWYLGTKANPQAGIHRIYRVTAVVTTSWYAAHLAELAFITLPPAVQETPVFPRYQGTSQGHRPIKEASRQALCRRRRHDFGEKSDGQGASGMPITLRGCMGENTEDRKRCVRKFGRRSSRMGNQKGGACFGFPKIVADLAHATTRIRFE